MATLDWFSLFDRLRGFDYLVTLVVALGQQQQELQLLLQLEPSSLPPDDEAAPCAHGLHTAVTWRFVGQDDPLAVGSSSAQQLGFSKRLVENGPFVS